MAQRRMDIYYKTPQDKKPVHLTSRNYPPDQAQDSPDNGGIALKYVL